MKDKYKVTVTESNSLTDSRVEENIQVNKMYLTDFQIEDNGMIAEIVLCTQQY
jgi:hypothetical protein